MQRENSELKLGLLSAIAAHVLWGVFPLFWRQVGHVDSLVVVCHRVIWAFLFLLLALPFLLHKTSEPEKQRFYAAVRTFSAWMTYGCAAALIAINWLTFIWAVNHDRVLEASLGYYINPLLNVFLGVLVLAERLTKLQWLAVAVATCGVGVITAAGGGLPWVSIVLACTFAMYALVKKQAKLPALFGLLLETAALLIPAVSYLALFGGETSGVLGTPNLRTLAFLVMGGIVTVMPLGLFAYAAHRVPLSTIGLLQYIGPSMQFFIGVYVLSEPFDGWHFVGFAFVWTALAIYLFSSRYQPEPPLNLRGRR